MTVSGAASPTHEEVAELLGAYALDAVEPDEAVMIETHLDVCPRCRAEVAAHREVAAVLAYGGASAPDGLWTRIAENLSPADRQPELARLYPLRRDRRRIGPWVSAAVASVAAVLVLMLGLQVRSQGQQIHSLQQAVPSAALTAGFQSALLDPSATKVRLSSSDGQVRADAVLQSDGNGYLAAQDLPALAAGRTYQLWGVVGARKLSLGVLGGHPELVPFRAATALQALAVTDEASPGVVVTTQTPVVVGSV